jgi:hypothetical protein
LKKAIGSCLGAWEVEFEYAGVKNDGPGEGVGEGAEKRSRGRPPGAVAAGGAEEDEALLELSEGRDRPPSPDIDN